MQPFKLLYAGIRIERCLEDNVPTMADKPLNILYITQYFPPEIGATQTRAFEMVRHLVKKGHKVTVLTEFPNHPTGVIPSEYKGKFFTREQDRGLDIIRTWVFTRPEKSFWTRIAFYVSFCAMALIRGVALRDSFDVVYATSPPLFVGLTGYGISVWKRAKFVLEIRDLWPESAVALEELSNRTFIRLAEMGEQFLYRRACRIVGVTQGILDGLKDRRVSERVVDFIPNGANIQLYSPGKKDPALRKRLGLSPSSFVVMFTGLHGLIQGLDFVVEAAKSIQPHRDIHFVFIGDGPVKPRLIQKTTEYGLNNIHFLDAVPEPELPDYIRTFDVGLVSRKKLALSRGILPVKMFSYMACEKPIIGCIEGEARDIVEGADAGLYSEPENAETLIEAILFLKKRPKLCHKMGKQGREVVEKDFSREKLAMKLEGSLRKVVEI